MNLYFPMNSNMKKAENDTKQALAAASLPDGFNAPTVTRLTVASGSGARSEEGTDQVLAALSAETFQSKDGQPVRLDQFATIGTSDAATSIQERDGQPFAVVTTRIVASNMSKISKDVQSTLAHIELPQGVTYSLGGISQ